MHLSKKALLVVLFFFLSSFGRLYCQQDTIAKLLALINNGRKCERLLYAAETIAKTNPDKSVLLGNIAKKIATDLKDTSHIVHAHFTLASTYYWGLSDHRRAKLELDTIGARYFKNLSDSLKCHYYSSLGDAIYYYGEEYVRSMELYFKALSHVGTDSLMLARIYHNISWMYADFGKFDKAIEFGEKSLRIAELTQNNYTHKLEGLSHIYKMAKNYNKALEYIDKAEKITTRNGKDQDYYHPYMRADLYQEKGDLEKSARFAFMAYEIAKKQGSQRWQMATLDIYISVSILSGNHRAAMPFLEEYEKLIKLYGKEYEISEIYGLLGELYLKNGIRDSSKYYLDLAENIQHLHEQAELGRTYKTLSDWYLAERNYPLSRNYLLKYIQYQDAERKKDSIKSAKAKNDQIMMFELENILGQKDAEIQKNALILENEKLQKNTYLFALILVFLLGAYVYKSLRDRKKSHKILSEKNQMIEFQNGELLLKNKEILDSIGYAKRLQEAILPPKKQVKECLPNSFILYKPKDIVAGDFYWMSKSGDSIMFAAADCTGHGVPGAMVSVVCSNALNRAVKEFGLTDPGRILDKVKELVVETFEKSEKEVNDGMDIALVSLTFDVENLKFKDNFKHQSSNIKLRYSGANNPLWLIRNKNLTEYKGDKQPIGKHIDVKPFTTQHLDLQPGDTIYIFSDGYADQFGGERGKKFKTSRMKELFLSIQDKNMDEQSETINRTFEDWKGELDQIDDVCMIGVRV